MEWIVPTVIGLIIGTWLGAAIMACFAYRNYQRGAKDKQREMRTQIRIAISLISQKVWESIDDKVRDRLWEMADYPEIT